MTANEKNKKNQGSKGKNSSFFLQQPLNIITTLDQHDPHTHTQYIYVHRISAHTSKWGRQIESTTVNQDLRGWSSMVLFDLQERMMMMMVDLGRRRMEEKWMMV